MKNNQTTTLATPGQAERLIDYLKDDTLSFGCWVISNNGTKGVIVGEKKNRGNKRWLCAVPDSHALFYINGGSEILGHDILLGDVLAKLYELPAWKTGLIDDSEVIHTWRKLGLTRSLQDIVRTGKEEIQLCGECGEEECNCVTQKWTTETQFTPESNALLQFLISIFLNNTKC